MAAIDVIALVTAIGSIIIALLDKIKFCKSDCCGGGFNCGCTKSEKESDIQRNIDEIENNIRELQSTTSLPPVDETRV